MKTEHQSVDRILSALRDAPTPAGMEGRILVALEASAAQASSRRAESLRGMFSRHVLRGALRLCWTPVAALAFLVVAVGISHYAHRRTSAVESAAAPHVTAPIAKSDNAAPQKTAAAPSHFAVSQHRRSELAIETVSVSQRTEAVQAEVADAASVSHPAPPMPPTEEEQLLLRFARRGRSQDLAQMSNERRAMQESREAEEFRAFFEPPVVNGESE
jgi:hypothetical protein